MRSLKEVYAIQHSSARQQAEIKFQDPDNRYTAVCSILGTGEANEIGNAYTEFCLHLHMTS